MIERYFVHLLGNSNIKLLLIFIVFDTVFRNIKGNKRKKNKLYYRN